MNGLLRGTSTVPPGVAVCWACRWANGRVEDSDPAWLGCEELIDLIGPAAILPYCAVALSVPQGAVTLR
jgi:hypothetical protein